VGTSFEAHADAAQEWVRGWSASSGKAADRARALSSQVAQLSVTASSADGTVQVTIDGSGAVADLRLGELVRKWPAADIAAEILRIMGRAQAMLATRVAEIAAQTVGADSATARAVVGRFQQRFPAAGTGLAEVMPDDVAPAATAPGGSPSAWSRRGR
jgi:YbaB/EbfC DNA-binding family